MKYFFFLFSSSLWACDSTQQKTSHKTQTQRVWSLATNKQTILYHVHGVTVKPYCFVVASFSHEVTVKPYDLAVSSSLHAVAFEPYCFVVVSYSRAVTVKQYCLLFLFVHALSLLNYMVLLLFVLHAQPLLSHMVLLLLLCHTQSLWLDTTENITQNRNTTYVTTRNKQTNKHASHC